MKSVRTSGLAWGLLLAAAPLLAQAVDAPEAPGSAPAAGDAVSVVVTGIKSPLEVPYQRAYDATRQVALASNGLADLVFKLRDREPVGSPMHVSVEYGDTVTPIALDASNGFVLVPDEVAAREHASLVVNRQSRAVGVQVDLRPHVPAAPLSVADARKMIEAGRAARATLLPWYARIVTPTIKAVRVCSHEHDARFGLRVPDGSEAPLPAIEASDVYGRAATCADMPAEPDAAQASAVLVAPADATYDYIGTLF